jgi:hypothetical protein
MKNFGKLRWLLLATSMAALALGSGCSDDNENPSPGNNVIGGTTGNGGSGNKAGSSGKAGSATDAGGDGTGNESGSSNVGAGGRGGNPIPECKLPETGEDGCFNCPETDLEYLNRCADGDCVAFDNARLSKLNADGSLPPLN